MGIMNVIDNPFDFEDWVYDIYLDYIASINESQDVETDITNKVYKKSLQAQASNNASGTNNLVYAVAVNKMSKRFITASCGQEDSASTQDCMFNTIAAAAQLPKVVITERVGYTTIPEDNGVMYSRILQFIENNTNEGRWPRPSKDADGNIQWVVEYLDADGYIHPKTHNVENQDLVVNEGTTLIPKWVTYTPVWRMSNTTTPYKVKDLNGEYRQEWAPAFIIDPDGKPTRQLDERWYTHRDSLDLATLGFGHLITTNNGTSITVNGITFDDTYGDGLTDKQAVALFGVDLNKKIKSTQNVIGAKRWNYLAANFPAGNLILVDLMYNTNLGPAGFPSLCAAMGIPQIPKRDDKGKVVRNEKTGKIVYTGTWTSDFTPTPGFKFDLDTICTEFTRPQAGNRDEMMRQILIRERLTSYITLGGKVRKDIAPGPDGKYLKKN